ncbi:Aste57867_23946 [Aphanomyces stellatus]|uniref:Aste57867_23946 protein n=1 Tax=Aphanomyces stellatus TaxID=120398 RepID=A0A485LQ65_9STRA|nr:hypothetical protein As57867_023873 [Aphanomyces stellatus]VFU00589.1 Aste57867_23946 [Aphanomyces stellatus]
MEEGTDARTARTLRFVCVSDTHGKHDQVDVPDGDVFIHAGDFSNTGSHNQLRRFAAWIESLPHAHKIVIAGNHEYSLDRAWYDKDGRKRHKEYQDPIVSKQILQRVCTYVENEVIDVGGVRIYGSPHSPVIPGCIMAFNLMPGRPSAAHWSKVPSDVDILVTHTPPFGILDANLRGQKCGDEDLLREVSTRIRPRYHIFGHIHECHGTSKVDGTTFVNAASCNVRHQADNPPIVFDIDVVKRPTEESAA